MWTAVAVACAGVDILGVLTALHDNPHTNPMGPIVWEATSWVTLVSFLWLPWVGFLVSPLNVRPRWRLWLHLPVLFVFSLLHVAGFVLLRKIVYRLQGFHYDFGPFWPNFSYEFGKDAVAYGLFVSGFAFAMPRLFVRPKPSPSQPLATFDIRDGAKLKRILLEDVLAVSSAGNYVEFVLCDGRRLSMRSSLSALETNLGAQGFLRTHRSWLVNPAHMTALKPQGSGDYTVDLGGLSVPLSRRYRHALNALRDGKLREASKPNIP